MTLSNAQRQARWRAKRAAELERLRKASSSQPEKDSLPRTAAEWAARKRAVQDERKARRDMLKDSEVAALRKQLAQAQARNTDLRRQLADAQAGPEVIAEQEKLKAVRVKLRHARGELRGLKDAAATRLTRATAAVLPCPTALKQRVAVQSQW